MIDFNFEGLSVLKVKVYLKTDSKLRIEVIINHFCCANQSPLSAYLLIDFEERIG